MTAVTEVRIARDDITESFPARGLRVSNTEQYRAATPYGGSRFLICPECGERFFRPTPDWGYMFTSAHYDRLKLGRARAGSKREWFFCSYHCFRAAQKKAQEQKAGESRGRRKIEMDGICAVCGEAFVKKSPAARYCSDECRKKIEAARSAERSRRRKEKANDL